MIVQAGDQGRQILQQAFRSIAAKHSPKRAATDGNTGAPQSQLAHEGPQASGASQQMLPSNQGQLSLLSLLRCTPSFRSSFAAFGAGMTNVLRSQEPI